MANLPPADGRAADEYWSVRRGVGLIDRGDWGLLELTGRDRATFLHALLSNEVKALAPGQGCAATLLDVHGKVQGIVLVWVAGHTGDMPSLRDALVGAGARPVGRAAFESLRIETGTPVLGRDVDESVLLPEIPFASLVSQTKGCYPGQEVVVRIRDRGHVNRMLVGLLLDGAEGADGADAPPDGAEVIADSAAVGRVTSSTWSFGLERPIALAFVRRQHAAPGSRVSVRAGERTSQASVSA